MKIPQMLLGAIALSIGITVAVANSETEQSVNKCVLPYPEMDNDTTKKQTKPISDKIKQTQKKPKHTAEKQLPETKIEKTETPKKNQVPIKIDRNSPEYCPACGMG